MQTVLCSLAAALRGRALALVIPALATAPPLAGQDLTTLIGTETSELAPVVERYSTDRTALGRRWNVPHSPERRAAFTTSSPPGARSTRSTSRR